MFKKFRPILVAAALFAALWLYATFQPETPSQPETSSPTSPLVPGSAPVAPSSDSRIASRAWNGHKGGDGASGGDAGSVVDIDADPSPGIRIALVNGHAIYRDQVRELATKHFSLPDGEAPAPDSREWEIAVNLLAQMVILEQAAERQGILEEVREGFGGEAERFGDMDRYIGLLEREVAETAYQRRVNVTPAAMREFYEQSIDRWRIVEYHLLRMSYARPASEEAELAAVAGLRRATTIVELDEAVSEYREALPGLTYHASVARPGDRSSLSAKLLDELESLRPGSVRCENTRDRVICVKLLKRETHTFPFEQVADEIRLEMTGRGHHNLRREVLDRLYGEAVVELPPFST